MNEREAIAWVHRRVTFGLAPGELDAAVARGLDAELDRLLFPDAHGEPARTDPWDEAPLLVPPGDGRRWGAVKDARVRWFRLWTSGARPLEEWLAWYWHDHFPVSRHKDGGNPVLLVRNARMLRERALGSFTDLLRAVTLDAAMLFDLDGKDNRAGAPNENYARELMELFTIGPSSFSEADVAAAASALTGWVVRVQEDFRVELVARRHDATPQRLLGRAGVSDVDGVIGAVLDHPAFPAFVARRLAARILGDPVSDAVIADAAGAFAANGRSIPHLVERVVRAGLAGAGGPVITGPSEWFARVCRATGASVPDDGTGWMLDILGEGPWDPPSPAGWDRGTAWFGSSTTVARANASTMIARNTPAASPALAAASAGDLGRLADVLGRPEGFAPATRAALTAAHGALGGDGRQVLAAALAMPDLVVT